MKNGYFQVIRSADSISLKLFPPSNGENMVEIEEIREYLENNQIIDYDLKTLNKVLLNLSEVTEVRISPLKGYPINEYMKISIDDDEMRASVRFYPPSNDGERTNIDELKRDLTVAGVVYNVNEEILQRQIENPEYCINKVIALGKPTREGKDAYITYLFNTDRKSKPKHNEDGSVDFHQLENISHIKKGDILAKLTMEDIGEAGINVLGQSVKPQSVERKSLKFGKNIILSEDRMSIISEVDGHVTLEGDKVFVSNTYEVPADVDNSTGDILYDGNVIVHGNVRTGFKIKASGDVEVIGAVEGAEIVSGGQVILHHGIQGMSKGIIVAKNNIITKFIESAKVHTEGYVEADAIIQSHVAAKGDVIVKGAKGNIIGGHIRSSSVIDAKVIGSPMGITTVVEVGMDPTIQDRLNKLKEGTQEKNNEYKKLVQVAEVMQKRLISGKMHNEMKMGYKKTLETIAELRKEIVKEQEEIEQLMKELSDNTNSRIKVGRVIYPGTKVIISGEVCFVNEELNYCQFIKQSGEVKTAPL